MIKICFLIFIASCKIQDKYCGNENCYDILQISNTNATSQDIKQAYRSISKIYHPDKQKSMDTTNIYRKINQAYEILRNENLKLAYDQYLNNPQDYLNYYKYYKAAYAPKSDIKLVILTILFLMSLFQFIIQKGMYFYALNQIYNSTRFKTAVNNLKNDNPKLCINEIKNILKMNVRAEGYYENPKLKNLILIKIIVLPHKILYYIFDNIRWVVKYRIFKMNFNHQDKVYLTYKNLGIDQKKWNMIPLDKQIEYLSMQLWVDSNRAKFFHQLGEKQNQMIMGSNKYKQYLRQMKKIK